AELVEVEVASLTVGHAQIALHQQAELIQLRQEGRRDLHVSGVTVEEVDDAIQVLSALALFIEQGHAFLFAKTREFGIDTHGTRVAVLSVPGKDERIAAHKGGNVYTFQPGTIFLQEEVFALAQTEQRDRAVATVLREQQGVVARSLIELGSGNRDVVRVGGEARLVRRRAHTQLAVLVAVERNNLFVEQHGRHGAKILLVLSCLIGLYPPDHVQATRNWMRPES